ncbi:trigger factor [Metabacillus fastidiosus]|uniref:trigger factor n=1 Tax=Metabacillus fastidiosus TaxID=1458 RepID=UPI002DB9C9B4|nr:trigger factor [Metabacillus fastidiosus]MEC2076815.1 trigger factor [Metabacillus fastidiosus]
MSVKWEKLEGNEGVLTIEVPAEDFNTALDEAFKKVSKQVSIPGFRKGKIPRGMFEQRFGVEALYEDALDIILPTAYPKAVDEAGIDPVDRPEIDVEQIEKGKSVIFKAKVTVKPEVKLGEYKGLAVEKMDTTVTDEDIENELKTLQERNAELVVKESGAIENGDTVVIDFEGSVDGEVFEGGTAENYSLDIGSGTFIPGFEEQLVGVETGAEKNVEVTFPEEYHAENLAGKPAVFKVKVHEIKGKQLPALDDEFAKDVDEEVETLDELKAKTKTRLEEAKTREAGIKRRDELVAKAAETVEIDIPQAMVDSEVDRMYQEFEQRLTAQGMSVELYAQFTGQDEAALRDQMKEDAAVRVKYNLVLEAIVKAENIDASDEEVEEEINKIAETYNMPVENVRQALGGAADNIKEEIKIRKAIEFLVENSTDVA